MTNDELIQTAEEELRRLQQHLAETSANPNGDSTFIEEMIGSTRAELLYFYHRRYKVLPPYHSFIQLAIDSPCGKKREYVKYNVKLYQARKNLSETLFGKRRHAVSVKVLDTNDIYDIIRLPRGLKLNIRKLETWSDIPKIYKTLQPIVKESSYPLDGLKLACGNTGDLEHPVTQTAAKLTLLWVSQDIKLLTALLNLKNQEVHWKNLEEFSNEDHILLVQNWLDTGRKVGTCFTFEVENLKSGMDFVELTKERFNCAFIGERFAIIPMCTISELKISYEEDPNAEEYWILKLEVIPNKTAMSSV